jgi:biopolymer transport protein TolR
MGLAGGGRRRRRAAPMAEINVTPMVDVMLVLLIIFMVTAPLLVTGVPVDLPAARAAALSQKPDKPLAVSLDAQGGVFIGDEAVAEGALGDRLSALHASAPDTRVLVRADKSLSYGRVLEVMGEIASSGFTKVALVSQPPKHR